MNDEALVVSDAGLIGNNGAREKLTAKLNSLKKDGYLSVERRVIQLYARKLMCAMVSISHQDLGLGREELRSLECGELAILAQDIFERIGRRVKFSIAFWSIIPLLGWVRLLFSLDEGVYDSGSIYIAYWNAYKKLRSGGDKALELAFRHMKDHNFAPWYIE
ncbi:MAG: hypothetical protein HYT62_04380 [Candidatus Yanofskybacteria bacterium]|nr:hypothetical protein [Candidatus Yanofskybacteria bacterium]